MWWVRKCLNAMSAAEGDNANQAEASRKAAAAEKQKGAAGKNTKEKAGIPAWEPDYSSET